MKLSNELVMVGGRRSAARSDLCFHWNVCSEALRDLQEAVEGLKLGRRCCFKSQSSLQ